MSRAAAPLNATEATKPVSSPLELTTVNHETNIARPATAAAMWVRVEVISLALWLSCRQSWQAGQPMKCSGSFLGMSDIRERLLWEGFSLDTKTTGLE